MSVHDQLNLYIKQISKGLVNLKPEHTAKITEIIIKSGLVEVKKFRFNGANNLYEPLYSIWIDKDDAQKRIIKYKVMRQYEGFYKLCIPSLDFEIYTVNINLLG